MTYFLSVCAIFKNESHSLKEWIEHYLYHGVQHFYLLNDESDDNYYDILEPFIKRDIITLIDVNWDRYLGRQEHIYNHYILPKIKESKWWLICDLDEFMWSTLSIDLKTLLKNDDDEIAIIQVVQTLFGSNNYIKQPNSIVHSFTKRRICQYGCSRTNGYKYFINSSYPFKTLSVHYAVPKNEYDEKYRCKVLPEDSYFILNHYSCQSKERFEKKCNKISCNNFKILTIKDFPEFDINEVDDTRLSEQNKFIDFKSMEYNISY